MNMKMHEFTINKQRFMDSYNRLVDETENPDTYLDKRKTQDLRLLLDVFEYLMEDENNVNPLDEIFGEGD